MQRTLPYVMLLLAALTAQAIAKSITATVKDGWGNGVTVQDDMESLGRATHRRKAEYLSHETARPLELHDHGDKVRFRNIWIIMLNDDGTVKKCAC